QATPFVPGQNGFVTRFGMGFASNAPAAGETLYVAASGQLATIDTNTFALRVIAQSPVLYSAELTGTDSGQLYAFFQSSFTAIAQVDKTTGYVPQLWTFNLPFNDNWAFAAWKGAFYTFTGLDPQQQLGTVVNRFDPSTDTLTPVSVLEPDAVVGAGVSTCAPGG
ncbi:MAG: hypothetical protein FWD17_06000, partial [Polyangiaceae bacterium]|nr:hypothetical protein [Polyangiaceae bacterium]